jgi:hypothetical protein
VLPRVRVRATQCRARLAVDPVFDLSDSGAPGADDRGVPNQPPSDPLAAPGLAPFADLSVQVAAPIEVGETGRGLRRVIPILGGTCVARDWRARVLEGGADFQLVVDTRVARLEARYVLETDAGDRIYVHNDAVRTAPPEVTARLLRGEPVDPADVYFRCAPRFETSAPALAWMMERVFLGTGLRRPAEVVMRFFEVL